MSGAGESLSRFGQLALGLGGFGRFLGLLGDRDDDPREDRAREAFERDGPWWWYVAGAAAGALTFGLTVAIDGR